MNPEGAGALADLTKGKEDGALRTIGEVAEALGIRQHVLRYWEEQFPMLRPLKRNGGRRYYRPNDVRLIEKIDRLVHREGYTLKGANVALKGGDAPDRPSSLAAAQPSTLDPYPGVSTIDSVAYRAQLIMLRTTLAAALLDS